MIALVKLIEVKALDFPRFWVKFSNGREGVRDLSDVLADGGPMVEPLRDPALFCRLFVQCGVPTWPNGFGLDVIALHDEMLAAGSLQPPRAA